MSPEEPQNFPGALVWVSRTLALENFILLEACDSTSFLAVLRPQEQGLAVIVTCIWSEYQGERCSHSTVCSLLRAMQSRMFPSTPSLPRPRHGLMLFSGRPRREGRTFAPPGVLACPYLFGKLYIVFLNRSACILLYNVHFMPLAFC